MNTNAQLKSITFRVSPSEHKAIKDFCRRRGESDMNKFFRRVCREQIPGMDLCSRRSAKAYAAGNGKTL